MDLAARNMLNNRSITLLTDPKNLELFQNDRFLELALAPTPANLRLLSQTSFDLVLLDSFSPKTLNVKIEAASRTPFVGLYGFLNGYEVHRITYAYRRLERLLGMGAVGNPKLVACWPAATPDWALVSRPKIAIAVGGEWAFRTYRNWESVIAKLIELDVALVLVGSNNGAVEAELLEKTFPQRVSNLVGKTTLRSVIAELSSCRIFVGADGGLWHLASACGLPSIALHADCQLYDHIGRWCSRAGSSPECVALNARHSVNEIPPGVIVDSVLELLSKLKS